MARVSRSIRSDSRSRLAELAALGHPGPLSGANRVRSLQESLNEKAKREAREGTDYEPLAALCHRGRITESPLRNKTRQAMPLQDYLYHEPMVAVLSSYEPGGLHMFGLVTKRHSVRTLTG